MRFERAKDEEEIKNEQKDVPVCLFCLGMLDKKSKLLFLSPLKIIKYIQRR